METRKRSLLKSVIWRLFAVSVTFGLGFVWLQDVSSSLALAASANAIKAVAYYAHERLWNRVSWGQLPGLPQEAHESNGAVPDLESAGPMAPEASFSPRLTSKEPVGFELRK